MNTEGMVGTESKSVWVVTPTKWSNQNAKTTCTSLYHRKEVYKISSESDERCRKSCGDEISDLQSICQHGQ